MESETYRGTRVREITEREMHEASLVRGVLEQAAAVGAAAALRGDTAGLNRSLEGIEQAAKDKDFEAYARHYLEFHRQIVEAAGNEVMLRVWDSLMLETLTLIGLNSRPLDLDLLAAAHRPIRELALHHGDAPKPAGCSANTPNRSVPTRRISPCPVATGCARGQCRRRRLPPGLK